MTGALAYRTWLAPYLHYASSLDGLVELINQARTWPFMTERLEVHLARYWTTVLQRTDQPDVDQWCARVGQSTEQLVALGDATIKQFCIPQGAYVMGRTWRTPIIVAEMLGAVAHQPRHLVDLEPSGTPLLGEGTPFERVMRGLLLMTIYSERLSLISPVPAPVLLVAIIAPLVQQHPDMAHYYPLTTTIPISLPGDPLVSHIQDLAAEVSLLIELPVKASQPLGCGRADFEFGPKPLF